MKKTKKGAHVTVATPCQTMVHSNYMVSTMFMFLKSLSWKASRDKIEHPYDYIDGTFVMRQGSMLPLMRDELVLRAIDQEATHILFIDSDMSFCSEMLIELLRHDVDVVAVNAATKQLPITPTVRLKAEDVLVPVYQRDSHHFKNPLQKVHRVGTGIMLIKTDVFKKMKRPYFFFGFDEEAQQHVGEDWGFCSKLDELGIPIYVDFRMSETVGHSGELVYTHEMDGKNG